MKTIEDMRLEAKVSAMILDLVHDAQAGQLDDVPNGDVQGICEALAMKIIETAKEVK